MLATVVIPIRNNMVLLARKMKKIGAGKWNGFGGKQEPTDITLRHTACRELHEETSEGIIATPESLSPRALIKFYNFNNHTNNPDFEVAFYVADRFEGEAKATEEMAEPTWFDISKIPYEEMLPADKEFLPLILSDKQFIGSVRFNSDMSSIIHSEYTYTDLTHKL